MTSSSIPTIVKSFEFDSKDRTLDIPKSNFSKEQLSNCGTERNCIEKKYSYLVDSNFESPIYKIDLVYHENTSVKIKNLYKGVVGFDFIKDEVTAENVFDEDIFLLIYNGGYCWQHFVQDTIPFIALFYDFLKGNPNITMVLSPPSFDYFKIFINSLCLSNKIILVSENTILKTTGKIYFSNIHTTRELYLSEYPMSLYKNSMPLITSSISSFFSFKNDQTKLIYISRKDDSMRQIGNEEDLCKVIKDFAQERKLEYTYLNSKETSISDKILLFNQAKIVIAPHGGANFNVIFCQPDVSLLEICFGKCLHTIYWMAKSIGLNYFMHVERDYGHFDNNIKVDINSFKESLKQI